MSVADIILILIAIEFLVLLDRQGWGFRHLSWQARLHLRFERWNHRRKGWLD